MRLQSKLLAAFGVMAAIILAVAILGYVEVRRLGAALYEIGVVRLPSIEGLERINEAKTALADSLDTLMSADDGADIASIEAERQRRSWVRASEGRKLYEPLPQTTEESVLWKQFTAAWARWKEIYEELTEAATQAHANGDRALMAATRGRYVETHTAVFASVSDLLDRLIALNSQIAAEARLQSIASYEDMIKVQRVMIGAAAAGVIGAVLLAVGVGRRIIRPMTDAVRTLSRIAEGDFAARLHVSSHDEVGEMAIAMNSMAEALSEARRAELARQILEAQLRQAQKLEAVGQLAAGVAHDFNNILAAIILHLDILRIHPETPPKMRGDLGELSEGAKRGAHLTRQLLLFSRKAVMRADIVDLNVLLTNFLEMLQRLIGAHIRIELVRAQKPPLVLADSGMIEQVVMNLVVNARDAMPEGGRVLLAIDEVKVAEARVRNERASPGGYVRLKVTDRGCGMTPEVMERIFEPFFTTKGPDKGTGLGLPTVFGIAQEHGGWVEVESVVGEGSTFSVLLPAQRGLPPRAGAARLAGGALFVGGESILVAEDNLSVRQAAATILRNQGYRVFEAPDEATAKSILENPALNVDLLVVDSSLPGARLGQHLAAYLRNHERRPKVILMSGFNPEAKGPGEIGAYTYLPKPFDAAGLLRVVRECLDAAE